VLNITKKLWASILPGLLVCGYSDSQTGASRNTQDERQAELSLAVRALRNTGVEIWQTTVPGLAAAIVGQKPSEIQVAVASGAADPPGHQPLQESSRFHGGSATKTSAAASTIQSAPGSAMRTQTRSPLEFCLAA
jgi:hypothetical protein